MKLSIFLILLLFTISLAAFKSVSAQCGAEFTSCYMCHDINGEMPVMYKEAWHKDHSFGYLCDFCHGGNMGSMIKEKAHENMTKNPLKYAAKTCEPCHPDYKDRIKKYEAILKENGSKDNQENEKK